MYNSQISTNLPLTFTSYNLKLLDMKNVMIAFVLFIFVGFCQAQDKKEEIPAAAKSAFAAKFPAAQKVKWNVEKPGEFEAEFKLNGVESSATYDAKGQCIEIEVEIKESELPQAVKAIIAKDFAGFKLDEVEKATDAKGVVSYEMEAAKGKEKYDLSFDGNGKLLTKEAAKDEKD
jgi:midasin (ATPase involved in ribosome maturation)